MAFESRPSILRRRYALARRSSQAGVIANIGCRQEASRETALSCVSLRVLGAGKRSALRGSSRLPPIVAAIVACQARPRKGGLPDASQVFYQMQGCGVSCGVDVQHARDPRWDIGAGGQTPRTPQFPLCSALPSTTSAAAVDLQECCRYSPPQHCAFPVRPREFPAKLSNSVAGVRSDTGPLAAAGGWH